MSLKTESITLDEVIFETTQFPAMRSYALLIRLTKVLGPALSALTGIDPGTRLEDLGPVLGLALGDLAPAEAQSLLLEVLASTTAQVVEASGPRLVRLGTPVTIDTVFSGRLPIMFRVLAHALKVNYSSFFEGGAPPAPPLQAPNVG